MWTLTISSYQVTRLANSCYKAESLAGGNEYVDVMLRGAWWIISPPVLATIGVIKWRHSKFCQQSAFFLAFYDSGHVCGLTSSNQASNQHA